MPPKYSQPKKDAMIDQVKKDLLRQPFESRRAIDMFNWDSWAITDYPGKPSQHESHPQQLSCPLPESSSERASYETRDSDQRMDMMFSFQVLPSSTKLSNLNLTMQQGKVG
ncbi:hypothetical protein HYFRA_00004234 [Hymenoscyphus fraxineus]|uniref:Uncharacterized protein n=1 Tax=Hymenoscyphus fraxineus TaxID=746836 RepID=A0A9N9KPT2_9HELO|nr:hypothetical protein HYFRA_00004234 [Hymenoscyphus fraxineus]